MVFCFVLFLYSITSVRVTTGVFIYFFSFNCHERQNFVLFCFIFLHPSEGELVEYLHTYWRKSSKMYLKGELRRKSRENFVGSQFSTHLLGASSEIYVLKDKFVHVNA